ncbi:MAG: GDP-L-fucose synthase family protein [Acidobacteriaceae bacterium]
MDKSSRIYVAGHTGLIGSAVVRRLQLGGSSNVITASHFDLELTDALAVDSYFDGVRPEYVVLAAGRVGGIIENQTYPADFMYTNLAIQLNVLRAALRVGVKRLILFGSSCMYPRECPQPMSETALFSGYPEPTSLAYAVSKLAGMQMCLAYNQQYGEKRFIPVIPNSVFGPNDNFDPESGHVLSALIRRFHEAKATGAPNVTLWGSGNPRREFIHADDVALACLALLEGSTSQLQFPLNLGTGKDFSIRELAEAIAKVVGYTGKLEWDTSKPDGAPRKLLDSSRILAFGWQPTVDFTAGLKSTYQWYLESIARQRVRP